MTKRPIPRTTREPDSDLRAQLRAVADPRHPKDTMFVARGSRVPDAAPAGVRRVDRPEGTMLTTSPGKARAFAKGMSDAALGYPESKAKVMRDPNGARVIQARDAAGSVVTEAATSRAGASKTVAALAKHVPPGGRLVATTAQAGQARRRMKP